MSMRSLATGIGSCKTEFHLPKVKSIGGSHPQIYLLNICYRVIKVLTSGTHIHAETGLRTGLAPSPVGPGTKPVGTLCQPNMDIPNVNT